MTLAPLALFASLPRLLWSDEHGFLVSGELVIVATVGVLALVVGLAEVGHNVNQELEDVGSAFAGFDQTYYTECTHGHRGGQQGSGFGDQADFCAGQDDIN